MRILFFSDAPWCRNGFGTNLRYILPGLAEKHDVAIQCIDGLSDRETDWRGIQCYPNLWSRGEFLITPALFEAVEDRYNTWKADVVVIHMDTWLLTSKLENTDIPFITYTPIDGDPPSPFTILSIARAKKVVAMCEWAERMLKEKYDIPSVYIPHGIDPAVDYPAKSQQDKMGYKIKLGIPPDKFVFTMVAANLGTRKAFPETMEAFSKFVQNNPKAKVLLLIHSELINRYGFNLLNLANIFKIRDKVMFSDDLSISDKEVGDIFRASDVLLNCSQGEGFGRSIIEAAACGVPAIVTDFTSMSELVSEGRGLKVGVVAKQCQMLNYTFYGIPSIPDITKSMETYYSDRELLEEHSNNCKKLTVDRYSWDKVIKMWSNLFEG